MDLFNVLFMWHQFFYTLLMQEWFPVLTNFIKRNLVIFYAYEQIYTSFSVMIKENSRTKPLKMDYRCWIWLIWNESLRVDLHSFAKLAKTGRNKILFCESKLGELAVLILFSFLFLRFWWDSFSQPQTSKMLLSAN